jgi:hypothetical protein
MAKRSVPTIPDVPPMVGTLRSAHPTLYAPASLRLDVGVHRLARFLFDDRGINHPDSSIMGSSKCVYDAADNP